MKEEVTWEQWIINVTAVSQPQSEDERAVFIDKQRAALTNALRLVLEHASSETGRAAVPRITEAPGPVSPFPFHVSARVGGMEL
jgi:hypothetical protein